ncbi:MAG: lipocalin family protein [Phycisphaerales bacterium]|nr:MAG: lipocalin family protein [Phycisphaerales bacterium]
MKLTAMVIVDAICLGFVTGCTSLPRQASGEVNPETLIGKWESVDFNGLCAGDFSSETLTFRSDSRFQEETTYADGVQTELDGTYRVEGRRIVLDDGDGYTPSIPFYLGDDTLIIARRANIGRVRVTLARVD